MTNPFFKKFTIKKVYYITPQNNEKVKEKAKELKETESAIVRSLIDKL